MKKKIFVTGASSFLGKKLIRTLVPYYDVTVLVHQASIHASPEVGTVVGGIEDIPQWQDKLAGIDIVIHIAALTHSRDMLMYDKINAIGTRDLVKASEQNHVKQFIFISTQAIGPNCGAYGESKKMAEEYTKQSTLPYTILRIGNTYDDTFSNTEGLGYLVSIIKKSLIIPYPYGTQSPLSPIHIDDVEKTILTVIENPITYHKSYVVAGPENLYIKEIMERICAREKLTRVYIPIPIPLIRIIFYFLSHTLRMGSPDQLDRFLCSKEPASTNLSTELHMSPRRFL